MIYYLYCGNIEITMVAVEKAENIKRELDCVSIKAKLNGTPTSDDLQRMTIQLNQMGVKSASGMEFTPERLRSAYHNLKRIYK